MEPTYNPIEETPDDPREIVATMRISASEKVEWKQSGLSLRDYLLRKYANTVSESK